MSVSAAGAPPPVGGGASESGSATAALATLVSRAHALVAELRRLSTRVPPALVPEAEPKYASVLFDLSYFKAAEAYEERLEAQVDLLELDDELRENYAPIIERFYQLFDRLVLFHADLLRFIEDLTEGTYIQDTIQGVLTDVDGRQLLVEALAMWGTLMMLVDERFDPAVRERVVVAHSRYRGDTELANFDEVCRLVRSTGFRRGAEPSKQRPRGYPEDYLARFPLPESVVRMALGRLRLDDIYNQISHYPSPEHRSTALGAQATAAFVLLFFCPEILHNDSNTMREIVDKHFADDWVIPWTIGHTMDLHIVWDSYKAAKMALVNAIPLPRVGQMAERASEQLRNLKVALAELLSEGKLTEAYVLNNVDKILTTLRDANVMLRWLVLHSASVAKKARGAFLERAPSLQQTLQLLLDTSVLEQSVKKVYSTLLDERAARWENSRKEAVVRINELAEFYAGSKVLSRTVKDDSLRKWFGTLSDQLGQLSVDQPVAAGRKLVQLSLALEDVQQFHQIDTSIQTKTYLADTRAHLQDMVRTLNVAETELETLTVVSDMSYAWGVIDQFTPTIHENIRKDPFVVAKLRAAFLKVRSMIEVPLLRISQTASADLYSVSEYYSSELVAYVRSVLEVIPLSMFNILNRIITVQTSHLHELPTRLEKAQLKEYAQLDERFQLAEATHQVAVFTQGILAMDRTFMGVIELDPKKLLEDGIRKQLVREIAEACHNELRFSHGKEGSTSIFSTKKEFTVKDFNERLGALANKLNGFRQSFEYIQDYVNMYGLRVWNEEFSRIISYNVEQECNMFLKRKQVHDWQSDHQNDAIPIPRFKPTNKESRTFIGRLVRELLRQTDSTNTLYLFPMSGWFDADGARELVGLRTFELLKDAVGVVGLAGMDRLLSFMIVHRLQKLLEQYRTKTQTAPTRDVLAALRRALEPAGGLPEVGTALYTEAVSRASKLWGPLLEGVVFLGHAQLLRRQVAAELAAAVRLDSNVLSTALESANNAVLADVEVHYRVPDAAPYPSETPLLPELAQILTATGLHNPLAQIFVTQEPIEELPTLLFLFTVHCLGKYHYDPHLATLQPRSRGKSSPDCCPLIVGLLTLLRQHHASYTQAYLAYLGQYIRVHTQAAANAVAQDKRGVGDAPSEVVTASAFLEAFCRYGDAPLNALHDWVTPQLLDAFLSWAR